MGFHTKVMLPVLGTLLFAWRISSEGLGSETPDTGASNSSSDWSQYFQNPDAGSTGQNDFCVDCALCFSCYPNCSNNPGLTFGLDTDGTAIGCSPDGNTNSFWNCACDLQRRDNVTTQILILAEPCSFSAVATNVFASFCNYISATSASAAVLASATPNFTGSSPTPIATSLGTSTPSETTSFPFITPTTSATIGLSSLLASQRRELILRRHFICDSKFIIQWRAWYGSESWNCDRIGGGCTVDLCCIVDDSGFQEGEVKGSEARRDNRTVWKRCGGRRG